MKTKPDLNDLRERVVACEIFAEYAHIFDLATPVIQALKQQKIHPAAVGTTWNRLHQLRRTFKNAQFTNNASLVTRGSR